MKTVIRYNNRKLYLKDEHRYTSLKELRGFVKANQDFLVRTLDGRDLTTRTMRQIFNLHTSLNLDTYIDLIKHGDVCG